MKVILDTIFKVMISLRFAVMVILFIAASLACGTFLESYYDTRTASFLVYHAIWFKGLLLLFGLNILFVALSRWPWEKKHIPFLTAHLGILILLYGSWLTQTFGVDGSLRVSEGESASQINFEEEILTLSYQDSMYLEPVRWTPPHLSYNPQKIKAFDLEISNWIAHAEPQYDFKSIEPEQDEGLKKSPAFKLRLKGGPMNANEVFWIWGGDPAWSIAPVGPARFILLPEGYPFSDLTKTNLKQDSVFEFRINQKGNFQYQAHSRSGKTAKGLIKVSQKIEGSEIDPNWMGMKINIEKYIPHAANDIRYVRSKIQYGDKAPPSAIELRSLTGDTTRIWLGIGDQAVFRQNGKDYRVNYNYKRLILPFALKLNRFEMTHYKGSRQPATYQSQVTIEDHDAPSDPIVISMNEPLDWKGYTFYQASYVPESPRPVTSILSVNYDPGRVLKYIGSLLIVVGAVLLFLRRKIKILK